MNSSKEVSLSLEEAKCIIASMSISNYEGSGDIEVIKNIVFKLEEVFPNISDTYYF